MRNLSKERKQKLIKFQEVINYKFDDIKLLNRALTHSSFANEYKKFNLRYNERLEFLGDSVLGLIVSDYIFNNYKDYPEGELTKIRALVVCEPSLAAISKKIDLGRFLLLGKGEESTGGRDRTSILSDAFEAVIGAVYIDGGIEVSRKFILENLLDTIKEAVKGEILLDYKTELQELIQKSNNCCIEYRVIKEEGPDHNKRFFVEVLNNNSVLGRGEGSSKKEAEQEAAKSALKKVVN
ncbi:ribonuclease III [Clostridium sp. D2Q-11]|uniref:Ribonuclease 3 n=1 Tax=Anaeromonas frigoriresistens TaxID=2683708 RepID=A0A942Z7P4_9FIRM|nr:ribonuclease III [Anaeromonas frigoriresistens]MBS4539766.1 ribonuclease III [Anaeromonas frigoriresistens]